MFSREGLRGFGARPDEEQREALTHDTVTRRVRWRILHLADLLWSGKVQCRLLARRQVTEV